MNYTAPRLRTLLSVLWQQSSGISDLINVVYTFYDFSVSLVTLKIPSCLRRKCTGDTSVCYPTALVRHCSWCGVW